MLNEKEMLKMLSDTTAALTDTVAEREQYKKWWLDSDKINKEQDATIKSQHEEILRLTEELNVLRDTGTIVVHDKGTPKEDA